MSYQQALSGLSGASSDLDVIGNNIANSNTYGFKSGTAIFADMYANSMQTAVSNQVGIGTRLAEVQQSFSQGTITTTNQALDVAINGNGFYQLSNNGSTVYSRNGVFHLDNTGKIVNSAGLQLMGYAANSKGIVNSASTVPLTVPTANVSPTATTKVTTQFNLNSQDKTPVTSPFDPTDANTFNTSTSVNVYDSLGGTQKVSVYFVKNTTGSWDAYTGSGDPVTTGTKISTLAFDMSGNLTSGAKASFSIPNGADPSGATSQTMTMDFTGTTQYGATSGVTNITQDGNTSGSLTGFTIGNDGTLTGNYSNGKTQALGQIALANFNNQNGLQDLGGNVYGQTAASGAPQVSVPGSTNHGTLQGGAVEDSNVDLTSELVNLITAQRDYQANAQTIKTQQTVDQTLMNL